MQPDVGSKLQTVLKGFVALWAGAVVPAIVIAIAFSLSLASLPDPDLSAGADLATVVRYRLGAAAIAFVFALVFTTAIVFILGLPLLLLGLRLRAIRWWSVLLMSFVLGFVPSLWSAGFKELPIAALLGVLGMSGGLTVWLLWRFWVRREAVVSAQLSGAG